MEPQASMLEFGLALDGPRERPTFPKAKRQPKPKAKVQAEALVQAPETWDGVVRCAYCKNPVRDGEACRSVGCEYAWAEFWIMDDEVAAARIARARTMSWNRRNIMAHSITCWQCYPPHYLVSFGGADHAAFELHKALGQIPRIIEGWPDDYCAAAEGWRASGHEGGREGCPDGVCDHCTGVKQANCNHANAHPYSKLRKNGSGKMLCPDCELTWTVGPRLEEDDDA